MKKITVLSLICFAANTSIAQSLPVSATRSTELYQTVTAGINEVSIESAIKIFPNPAVNEIAIIAQEDYEITSGELFIYDAAGKIVLHEKNITFKDKTFIVNVKNFENGLYTLVLNTKNRKATINKKFVISK